MDRTRLQGEAHPLVGSFARALGAVVMVVVGIIVGLE